MEKSPDPTFAQSHPPLPGWYPIGLLREFPTNRARQIWLANRPWAVWRTSDEVYAIADHCPHRGAPLSQGRVALQTLECPYHGWRFDARGQCVERPAAPDAPCSFRVPILPIKVSGGIVFAPISSPATIAPWSDEGYAPHDPSRLQSRLVKAEIADIAENILDTTHTSVLHQGYVRTGKRRRDVQAVVRTGRDFIEAHYPADAAPSGWLGRMIGGQVYEITDRFRAPNIAEVDYSRDGRLAFQLRFYLTPAKPGSTLIIAANHVPPERGPFGRQLAQAQSLLVDWALGRVFDEDTEMLESLAAHRKAWGVSRHLLVPEDLVRAGIDAILTGDCPTPLPDAISLKV